MPDRVREMQYDGSLRSQREIADWTGGAADAWDGTPANHLVVRGADGADHWAAPGDWIVERAPGDFYPERRP